jgi:hypothetical protein
MKYNYKLFENNYIIQPIKLIIFLVCYNKILYNDLKVKKLKNCMSQQASSKVERLRSCALVSLEVHAGGNYGYERESCFHGIVTLEDECGVIGCVGCSCCWVETYFWRGDSGNGCGTTTWEDPSCSLAFSR